MEEVLLAQRLDKVEDTVVPDTGIGIGSVIDEVLLRGEKTCADQQPNKVVGSTPMGARYSIVKPSFILTTYAKS